MVVDVIVLRIVVVTVMMEVVAVNVDNNIMDELRRRQNYKISNYLSQLEYCKQ